jgi:hypothetical protein
MRSLFIVLAAFALLECGCGSHHTGPVYHAGDEHPPAFLTGSASVVLANLGGFDAHIEATIDSTEGTHQHLTGDLLGREGRLVYQPALPLKGKRARREGGLFFIWDEDKKSGYVMSEALQGYAPVQSDKYAVGALHVSGASVPTEIDGKACHKSEGTVELSNGLQARVTVWRSDEEGHFPIMIHSVDPLADVTLTFSEVHQRLPSLELFRPPDGFTAYSSSVALMNELIVRDASLRKKNDSQEFDEPANINAQPWHQMPIPQ